MGADNLHLEKSPKGYVMDLSQEEARRLRILAALFELAGHHTASDVSLAELNDKLIQMRDLGSFDLQDECRRMKDRGWVDFFDSLAGIGGVIVTPKGADAYQQFDTFRRSVVARRKQLRDTYLRWIYEEQEEGRAPTPAGFLNGEPNFLGVVYTEDDIQRVGDWLEQEGFVEGPGAWGHGGPLRPRVTTKGSRRVENGTSVNDESQDGVVHHSTVINGNANIANNSSHFSQTIHTPPSEWLSGAMELSSLLQQSMPVLPESVRRDVSSELELLDGEIAGSADLGRVHSIVSRIGQFLDKVGTNVLAAVISRQVNDFLSGLPQ
ncbi:hypothetical protein GCM10023068_00770 [Leifsonia shinshuensis]